MSDRTTESHLELIALGPELRLRWCDEHEAQDAGTPEDPLGYCWHSYYLEQATTAGDPCRMFDAVLREIRVEDET